MDVDANGRKVFLYLTGDCDGRYRVVHLETNCLVVLPAPYMVLYADVLDERLNTSSHALSTQAITLRENPDTPT